MALDGDLDASVISRLQDRDVTALEICYRSFGPRVQRLCRRLVGRDQAEDAAQEVFVKVFENASKFTGKSKFSTWLYQVALNHCLKRLEQEQRRRTLPIPRDQACSWSRDSLRAVDDREQVEQWIAALNAEQRAVIVLRELEGFDYREIAEILSLPIGTVMSRLHRARSRLIEVERDSRASESRPAVRVQPT